MRIGREHTLAATCVCVWGGGGGGGDAEGENGRQSQRKVCNDGNTNTPPQKKIKQEKYVRDSGVTAPPFSPSFSISTDSSASRKFFTFSCLYAGHIFSEG